MAGMSTTQLDGLIVVLGRLLHQSSKSFPSLLGLWQVMGIEFGSGMTCGGGNNLWVSNIQDYLAQSRIKMLLFHQFLDIPAPSLGISIFAEILLILRQKIQKASCGLLIVYTYLLRFQIRDPGPYLLQVFSQSNLSFWPYPNILSRLQFSLPSLSGMLKSLLKSSPLSGWWYTRR